MEEDNRKAELLAEKLGVSREEAQRALDAAGGDLLDAAMALQSVRPVEQGGSQALVATCTTRPGGTEDPKPLPPELRRERERQEGREAVRDFGTMVRGLLRHSIENRLEIWYRGRCTCTIPVLILIILTLVSFWIVIPLVFVGLFIGCRYRFSGPDLGKEGINRGMDQISQAVDEVKNQVKDEVEKRKKRGG